MSIPEIVIDTNVIVAGLISRRGSASRLLTMVGIGLFNINLSVPVVLEYEDVLLRESINLPITEAEVQDLLDFYCSVARLHEIFFLWRPFLNDPKDDMILELAVKSDCDSIITYNVRDFRDVEQFGLQVVQPASFLQSIGVLP